LEYGMGIIILMAFFLKKVIKNALIINSDNMLIIMC
jgi:hypothetical protein